VIRPIGNPVESHEIELFSECSVDLLERIEHRFGFAYGGVQIDAEITKSDQFAVDARQIHQIVKAIAGGVEMHRIEIVNCGIAHGFGEIVNFQRLGE